MGTRSTLGVKKPIKLESFDLSDLVSAGQRKKCKTADTDPPLRFSRSVKENLGLMRAREQAIAPAGTIGFLDELMYWTQCTVVVNRD